jgi:hypothetical protein
VKNLPICVGVSSDTSFMSRRVHTFEIDVLAVVMFLSWWRGRKLRSLEQIQVVCAKTYRR